MPDVLPPQSDGEPKNVGLYDCPRRLKRDMELVAEARGVTRNEVARWWLRWAYDEIANGRLHLDLVRVDGGPKEAVAVTIRVGVDLERRARGLRTADLETGDVLLRCLTAARDESFTKLGWSK